MKKGGRQKNRISKILYSGLAIMTVSYGALWFMAGSYTPGKLSELNWKTDPGPLVALNVRRDEGNRNQFYQGILIVRISNGKQQFIAGDWKGNLTDQGNLFIFGKYPEGYSNEKEQQLYYIAADKRIFNIKMEGIKGNVVFADENRVASYMVIKVEKKESEFLCVSVLPGGDKKMGCFLELQTMKGSNQARWNPEADQELIIKDDGGTLFSYDPFKDTHPVPLKSEDNSERYQKLNTLFQDNRGSSAKSLHSFLNFIALRNGQKWSLLRIPLFSKATWLSDGEHILIQERNQISVLEPATQKNSILLKEVDIGLKGLLIRQKGFNQLL